MSRYFDNVGHELALTEEVGRGGEGSVHGLAGRPHVVAKIYRQIPDASRVDKLTAMIARLAEAPDLAQYCAWPQALVYDGDGQCAGFLMARIEEHSAVHDVYAPEQRKAIHPTMGWNFLVRIAANAARMFASLHRHGVLVGDVNERNLLIGSDATVRLVDCDSFQVIDGDRIFRTAVGVIDYTPPELQGADFSVIVREPNHDRFGLAVIIFKLLFMGRHPYSGGATGELALAIRELQYDYGELSARIRHLVPLTVLSDMLNDLFLCAFGPEGTRADGRPSAEAWLSALDSFEHSLVECRVEPLHRHPLHATRCIWCQIETGLQYAYFAPPRQPNYVSVWSAELQQLDPLEAEFQAISSPLAPEEYVSPTIFSNALQMGARALASEPAPNVSAWYVRVLGFLLVLAGVAIAISHWRRGVALGAVGATTALAGLLWTRSGKKPWQLQCAQLRIQLDNLADFEREWRGEAHRFREQDRRVRAVFAQLVERYLELDRARNVEAQRLTEDTVRAELRGALAKYPLDGAKILGVSPDRINALLIRGVLTAAELERSKLQTVPGMSDSVIDAFIHWRQTLEAQVGGRQRQPASHAQFAAIDSNFSHLRDNLRWDMMLTLEKLQAGNLQADSRLAQLYADAEQYAEGTLALGVALLRQTGHAI